MNRKFHRPQRVIALMSIVAFAGLAGLAAAPAQASSVGGDDTLAVFDLETFIQAQPTTRLGYDYLKLATALQGVVNRDEPRLFYLYKSNYVATANNFDTDKFWLEQLRKDGKFLSDRSVVRPTDFSSILDAFAREFKGVVVWDGDVPATANVAATAAGVEKLLPVRYDLTPGSPYDELVVQRALPVSINLADKFTGSGTIPDIGTPSTGSAKNDAYRWAKARWLDTGRTNPLLMAYGLDGVTWSHNSDRGAQVVSVALPDKLSVGQSIDVSITLKNTGRTSWSAADADRLAATEGNQFVWSNLNGGYSESLQNQRVFLAATTVVRSGETVKLPFTITAPAAAGSHTFESGFVRDGVAWYPNATVKRTIEVTTEAQPTTAPVDQPVATDGTDADYPDLFNTFLPNADYYIAKKAFFFDLSPDATTRPNDDPTQPVGTDYKTLIELLRSQNLKAGKNIITIGGFVPWSQKYTTYVDPNASLTPVAAEWKYADTISGYNAQKDADAMSLVGLSNASVYRQVPLNSELVQKNDKGANGKTYDPAVKYVSFYMGDYDSGAWTAGALPALWNDPARGKLPLAWPPNPSLSERVPQVFNYLYETQSPNDYFVAGDNGAGYLNPMMLLAKNRPDGLPDFLNVWEKYNAKYYEKFDLDITGFLISGNSATVPLPVQQSYARFSPAGVGTNAGFAEPVVDGTAFQKVVDFPVETEDPAAYGEALAGMLRGSKSFFMLRDILIKPSLLVAAVDYVKTTYPELKFEVVDPYTSFRLYKEAKPWTRPVLVPTYVAPVTASPINLDGVAEVGEWDSAAELDVSRQSADVVAHGTVWGNESGATDLTAKYKVKWDAKNLYLLEQRTDDSLNFTEAGPNLWSSDASMMFLDLGHDKTGSAYLNGDYTVLVSPSGPDATPHVSLREGHDAGLTMRALSTATVASVIRDGGYTMEVSIPWSELQVTPFAPTPDALVGFTMLATDNDGPGNWGQIMWVGDGDNQESWGDLRFAGPAVP